MPRSASSGGPSRVPRVRLKVWLEIDGQYVFGHGLCEMLKAVEAAGSIKEAAARVGKSYRHVWGRIKEAETRLGYALVETRVGGKEDRRSVLTEAAQKLVRDFDALRNRLLAVAREESSGGAKVTGK